MLNAINKEIRLSKDELIPDYKEMKHLLGYYSVDPDRIVLEQMKVAMDKVLSASKPCALYSVFPVSCINEVIDVGFTKIKSLDLSKNLRGCHHVIVLGLTIGSEVDRLIQRASRLNPTEGYLLQAAGAACAESFANQINEMLKEEYDGYYLKPRFSPGYGDFDLHYQQDIFRAMPRLSTIGLSLMSTNIMAPSKSITALVGVCDRKDVPDYLPECHQCDVCRRKV